MSELYDSVDYNNLKFKYVGPTNDVRFYEYKDSKELFNAIKNNQIKFSEVENKQNNFLTKLNEVKMGKKLSNKKKRDYIEMLSDANYNARKNESKGKRLKILTPKQMLQRLPTTLAQVKAGNNSESLLNEIRQIVYSFYQSKQITKKVYNNIIKSINV